jgi:exodeoxyribonuclease VII large subunit
MRAATPTAGAEILTEGAFAAGRWMAQATGRMRDTALRRLASEQRHVGQIWQRLRAWHPRRQLNRQLQSLDDLQSALARAMRREMQRRQLAARALSLRLARLRPGRMLARRRELLAQQEGRLREQTAHRLRALRQQCEALGARLRLLGPEQVLSRGYSITLDAGSGQVIRAARETRPGQNLRTRLKSGEVRSVVEGGG